MVLKELFVNISIIFALCIVTGFIDQRFDRKQLKGQIFQGLIFGGITIVAMLFPLHLSEGIHIDSRSTVLSIGTLFFGPITGGLATVISIIYRINIGGLGVYVGLLIILVSYLFGSFFYNLRKLFNKTEIKIYELYLAGLTIHIFYIALILLFRNVNFPKLQEITIIIVVLFPIYFVLLGKVLLEQEENKEFVQQLKKSEKLFRTTLYSIGDGVITTNLSAQIVNMNEVAEKLTGWSEKEAKGKNIEEVFSIVNEYSREKVENPVNIVLKKGKTVGLANHTILISKNGNECSIADSGSPIVDDSNHISGVVLVFRDQTKENDTKQKLIENENKLKSLIENSPIGIHIFEYNDVSGFRLIDANDISEKILNINFANSIGEKATDIFFEDIINIIHPIFSEVLFSGEVYHNDSLFLSTNQFIGYLNLKVFRIGRNRIATLFSDETRKIEVLNKLAENETRLNAVLKNIPSFVAIKDENSKFIFSNNKLQDILVDNFLGKTPNEVFPPEFAAEVLKYDKLAFETGYSEFEFSSTKHGRESFLKSVRFRLDIKGMSPLIGVVITDITANKKIQKLQKIQYNITATMLKKASLLEIAKTIRVELNDLLDTSNFCLVKLAEETQILQIITLTEGSNFNKYIPISQTLPGYLINQNKALLLDAKMFNNLVTSGIINHNDSIPACLLGVPLSINGKPFGAIIVQNFDNPNAYDLDSQLILETIGSQLGIYYEGKQTEILLKESEEKFNRFAETSPFGILIYQEDKWVYCNPAGERISGYSAEELYRMNYWDIVSPEFKQLIIKRGIDRLMGIGQNESYEFSIVTKSGETKWVYLTGEAIDFLGKPAGFISIVDINERKEMEESLQKAKEKAEEMNRLKSYFFANMSHELRTPFMPIMGYAEILSTVVFEPEAKEMVLAILDSSKRLTDTLKKILDLTRLEFEKIDIKNKPHQLKQFLDEICIEFIQSAVEKGLELNQNCKDENLFANFDEVIVREIISNLLNNAIKYTLKGKVEVFVECTQYNGFSYCDISVKDTGIGIPLDKQCIIFDEFRQVSEGTTRNFQGTGLGLAVAKKYAERINAEIVVESKIGVGSIFTLRLKEEL